MHKYLRSIGFRSFTNERLDRLYYYKKEHPDRIYKTSGKDGETYIEFHANITSDVGISFRGRESVERGFHLEYYFPYLRGTTVSTNEQIDIIKESDREGYHGMCDDLNLGVELIFFLQDFFSGSGINNTKKRIGHSGVKLGALAYEGAVLFPIKQTVRQLQRSRETSAKRTMLMAAARNGDETAMDKLAREEMDMFALATKRAESEDIYSIVNTFFMPDGIESDKYSILGIISAVKIATNEYTHEEIYILKVTCNKIVFDVCINKKDLLGIPAVGRRLKAKVWMQGQIRDTV